MADASCGPSNAFKGLSRHLEQDRSHQQDRIAHGPHQPTQNFRSTPLNSGLNNQFSAFQQGSALPLFAPAPANEGALPHHGSLSSHPAQAAPFFPSQPNQRTSANGSWVNEFQHMSLTDTHTSLLHNQPPPSSVIGQPRLADHTPLNFPTPQNPALRPFQPTSTGFHPMHQKFFTVQESNKTYSPAFMHDTTFALDAQAEADLDKQFENAMDEWMLRNGPESETDGQSGLGTQEGDDSAIGLDTASAEATASQAPEEDPVVTEEQRTELSRAAQQLVDILADNDTEKFQNSAFIALMRRIASRELVVEGNDLVETSETPPITDTHDQHVSN